MALASMAILVPSVFAGAASGEPASRSIAFQRRRLGHPARGLSLQVTPLITARPGRWRFRLA